MPHLIEPGWGRAWGIFLSTQATFSELRRYLRRWLTVTDESGQKLLFRFYDPRVASTFLRSALPEDRTSFFNSMTAILTESSHLKRPWLFTQNRSEDHRLALSDK